MDDYTNKAIQQLREDEGLTDNLTDESARLLLDWAENMLKKYNQPGNAKGIVSVNNAQILQLVRSINRLSDAQSQMSETEFLKNQLSLLDIILNA
jgi:hypothetical protein